MLDFSKTVIYKIVCKDRDIKSLYVGSTCDIVRRSYCHKYSCNNIKSKLYNHKLYKCIRDNGGWDNWEIIKVCDYPCESVEEKAIKEREYYDKLDADLNINIPNRRVDDYRDEYRNRQNTNYDCFCGGRYTYANKQKHFRSKKHVQNI